MKIIAIKGIENHLWGATSPHDWLTILLGDRCYPIDQTDSFPSDTNTNYINKDFPTYISDYQKTESEILQEIVNEYSYDKEYYVLCSGGVNSTAVLVSLLNRGITPTVLYFTPAQFENYELFEWIKNNLKLIRLNNFNIREELDRYAKNGIILTGFNGSNVGDIGSIHGIPFLNNPLASIEEAVGFRRKGLMTPSTIVECFHNLRKAYKIPNELNALQYYRLLTLSSLWNHFEYYPKFHTDFPDSIINPFSDRRMMEYGISIIPSFTNESYKDNLKEFIKKTIPLNCFDDYLPTKTWIVKERFPTGDILTDEGLIRFDLDVGTDYSVWMVTNHIKLSDKLGIKLPKLTI